MARAWEQALSWSQRCRRAQRHPKLQSGFWWVTGTLRRGEKSSQGELVSHPGSAQGAPEPGRPKPDLGRTRCPLLSGGQPLSLARHCGHRELTEENGPGTAGRGYPLCPGPGLDPSRSSSLL